MDFLPLFRIKTQNRDLCDKLIPLFILTSDKTCKLNFQKMHYVIFQLFHFCKRQKTFVLSQKIRFTKAKFLYFRSFFLEKGNNFQSYFRIIFQKFIFVPTRQYMIASFHYTQIYRHACRHIFMLKLRHLCILRSNPLVLETRPP